MSEPSDSRLLRRFREVATRHARRPCCSDARESATFLQVDEAARRLALGLAARAPRGERVALLVPASCRWVQAFWGILQAGHLLVPLTEHHPPAEHARALAAARVTRLLISSELKQRATDALRMHRQVYPSAAPVELVELEALLCESPDPTNLPARVEGHEPAVLFFTSGTTAEPKRAVVSHDQLEALARLVGQAWGMTERDRLLHCLPLHHTHGLSIAFVLCALAGASQHFLARFVAEDVWRGFESSSVFMGVPTMHKRLLDTFAAQPEEVRSLWQSFAQRQRLITSGSASLPESLALGWRRLTGKIPLERFGMTEVGVALSNPLLGERRAGSCGQTLPGMQVRIVDDQGGDVAPGQPGEIWIRGPSVFSGYDGDDAATARSFSDGWFKSGDTALWLCDGFVKILGRTSVDIIKSGGYKISALEIEEALRRYPEIEDAAVVGLPDDDWGERVVAAVVAARPIETEALRESLKQELAGYKVPRDIIQVEALPRNALGKVTKPVLRERLSLPASQSSERNGREHQASVPPSNIPVAAAQRQVDDDET